MSDADDEFGAAILELANRLAVHSDTPGELTCLYMTPAHRATAAELRDRMLGAGMTVDIDIVGNVVGRMPSSTQHAKTLIIGSHYDTVRNAGRYDGRFGMLAGLVVIAHLIKTRARLPFDIELIAFAEEEGVRFGAPFIGSKAVAGRWDPALLELRDSEGTLLADLIRATGHDPADISTLARRPETLLGLIELHIEQGPVLLAQDVPVGIVTSIAGPVRLKVTVAGEVGHAGTVPMSLRRDALAAASEIVLAVEKRCADGSSLVGTVGMLEIPNAAGNVIPGRCELSLDIRAADDNTRDAALRDILREIKHIAARRKVEATCHEVMRASAVACSKRFQGRLHDAAAKMGLSPPSLPSGAGHDAMVFDGVTELAMLFVRCGNGGISHSPRECISADDAAVAARVLLNFITGLAHEIELAET